jgi:hypothetical protein
VPSATAASAQRSDANLDWSFTGGGGGDRSGSGGGGGGGGPFGLDASGSSGSMKGSSSVTATAPGAACYTSRAFKVLYACEQFPVEHFVQAGFTPKRVPGTPRSAPWRSSSRHFILYK